MDRETGKRQKTEGKGRNAKTFMVPAFILVFTLWQSPLALSQSEWPGVDESVVEKVAGEHGRHAHEPLINTDQGDLLLFFFLLAGAAGGFAAGYYWRVLSEKKSEK